MKLSKIIIAAAVGTSFMTLYSYIISKREKDKFVEPELLNELIDRSETLPDVGEKKSHPAGWAAHYGMGVVFVLSYYILWRRSLTSPGIVKGLVIGAASGLIGIIGWKIMFAANDNPPQNNRYKYYRQLFFAHMVFSVFALYGYKLPEYLKSTSLNRLTS
jgi:hypothetical protein